MFSKNAKQNTIRVASSDAPNDFQEVELSCANNVFFKSLSTIRSDFDKTGLISESSLAKFRDSTPLARQRIKELKSMKKTFFKELEVDAKKGNKMVEKSLRFYEALVEADRLRSTKGQKGKGKSSSAEKA